MGLDIRTPLGLLFTLLGVLLLAYGALTNGAAMYFASLGVNLNVPCPPPKANVLALAN